MKLTKNLASDVGSTIYEPREFIFKYLDLRYCDIYREKRNRVLGRTRFLVFVGPAAFLRGKWYREVLKYTKPIPKNRKFRTVQSGESN